MNRNRLSLILILAGILVCAVCFAGAGFDTHKFSTAPERAPVEESFAASDVNRIQVDLSTDDIFIGPSPDERVHVTYYTSEEDPLALVLDRGALTLRRETQKRTVKELFQINLSYNCYQAQFLVPEDFAGDIEIDVGTMDVRMEGLRALENVAVELTTGDLSMEDIGAAALSVNSSTGNTAVVNASVRGDMRVSATTGDCRLENVTIQGALTHNGSTGKTEFTRVTCESANVNGTTGACRMEGVNARNQLIRNSSTGDTELIDVVCESATVDGSTGDIRLKALDAKSIRLNTSTGRISGTLAGSGDDYAIESDTSTGENTLPAKWGGGERSLKVNTTTGDIDIAFEASNGR